MRFAVATIYKVFSGPLICLLLLVSLGLSGCRQETFVPKESNSNVRFKPYGIDTRNEVSYWNRGNNGGITGLCQTGPHSFCLSGQRNSFESILVLNNGDQIIQRTLDMKQVPGYNPENPSKVNLVNGMNGEVIWIPAFSDTVMPIVRFNSDLSIKRIHKLELFKDQPQIFRQYFSSISACTDNNGGMYIFFDHYFWDDPNTSNKLATYFMHVDQNDSVTILKMVAWYNFDCNYIYYKDGYIIINSNNQNSIRKHLVSSLKSGNLTPLWDIDNTHGYSFGIIESGDTLVVARANNTNQFFPTNFDSIEVRMIDLKTGKPLWVKQLKLNEPEDQLTISMMRWNESIVITYATNMDGKLIRMDHSGNIVSSIPIKGDNTKTQIEAVGIGRENAWIYGLSGRDNANRLHCFEAKIPLK